MTYHTTILRQLGLPPYFTRRDVILALTKLAGLQQPTEAIKARALRLIGQARTLKQRAGYYYFGD